MRNEQTLHNHRIITFPADSNFAELVIIRPPNTDYGHVWTVVELQHHRRIAERYLEVLTTALQMMEMPTP